MIGNENNRFLVFSNFPYLFLPIKKAASSDIFRIMPFFIVLYLLFSKSYCRPCRALRAIATGQSGEHSSQCPQSSSTAAKAFLTFSACSMTFPPLYESLLYFHKRTPFPAAFFRPWLQPQLLRNVLPEPLPLQNHHA